MANHLLTNEQKLDAVYQLLKKQEARESRKTWYFIIKWTIFLVIIYILATRPGIILDKVTAAMRPFIIENVKSMMDYEKNDLFKEMKQILRTTESQSQ